MNQYRIESRWGRWKWRIKTLFELFAYDQIRCYHCHAWMWPGTGLRVYKIDRPLCPYCFNISD